nr:uncharacterized protein LOC112295321 isoform X2 [Physcomitrium patens]|eukprot:XP_024402497.1 uncharacterized protein LOC112295321 isoform X2 [Physcomitrella patens]
MSALVKFSSASGSFPQLQLACARVTAAIARYSIDSDTFQEDAEKIIQEICGPLTDALAAKLEPVAASAAACIHAVVETELWKYAQDEIVHEVCHRTAAALNEKSTRTVAHMQLVYVLASTNPDALSIHGASLLRAGEDTLKETANSWQLRKSAAKLLQSVLTILDKESLETELHSALHVLESCRIDKMIHVRTAVSEALNIAKMLSSGNETDKSLGVAAERNGPSSWLSEDTTPFSPVSTRGTSPKASMGPRASRAISPSLVPRRGTVSPRASMSPIRAGTISPRASMSPIRAGAISLRASMSPIRAGTISPRASMSPIRAGTISPRASMSPIRTSAISPRASMSPIRAGTISPIAYLSPIRAGRSSPRAAGPGLRASSPNLRAASPNSQESRRLFYSSASTSTSDSVQIPSGRSNDRSRAKRAPLYPPRGVNYAHSPRSTGTPVTSPSSSTTTIEECESPSRRLLIANEIVRSRSTGIYPDEHATRRGGKYLRPPAPLISVASTPLLPTQLNALGVEFQDSKEAQVSKDFETDSTDSKDAQQESPSLPWLKLEGTNSLDQYSGLELATDDRAPMSSALSTSMETRRTNVGSARDAPNADVEVEKREVFTKDAPVHAQSSAAAGAEVDTLKNLARLSANLEEKTKSLCMAKDFISFVPPMRLVRSLSSLSDRESGGSYYEQDMRLSQDYLFRSNNTDAAELDAETSSEAGWSVRNNPIASEVSYISDSSDDEFDERRKADDFPRLRKVASLDATPREIHMISPDPKVSWTFDDGATLDLADRACNPEEVHDACHVRPPCVLTEANTTPCKLLDPIQAKDMDGEKPAATNGLWDVVHKDNQYNHNICEDATKELNCNNASPIRLQNQVDQGESGCYTVRTVKKHWKRLCWYTEAVLGGSLCVILALPLAMVASKALSGSLDLQSLVPT